MMKLLLVLMIVGVITSHLVTAEEESKRMPEGDLMPAAQPSQRNMDLMEAMPDMKENAKRQVRKMKLY